MENYEPFAPLIIIALGTASLVVAVYIALFIAKKFNVMSLCGIPALGILIYLFLNKVIETYTGKIYIIGGRGRDGIGNPYPNVLTDPAKIETFYMVLIIVIGIFLVLATIEVAMHIKEKNYTHANMYASLYMMVSKNKLPEIWDGVYVINSSLSHVYFESALDFSGTKVKTWKGGLFTGRIERYRNSILVEKEIYEDGIKVENRAMSWRD